VHIVDDRIKANIKQERNTIILREIPSDTPEAEIVAIFEGTRPVKGVRSDVGDTWFVNFDSEEDAREALLAIRDRKFNGQPVKARLKVENILRSFYTPPAPGLDGTQLALPPPCSGFHMY
jgi:la-related protein 4